MSLRDTIKAADDIDRRTVEVPEWGVTVEVRSPTVKERSDLIAAYTDTDGEIDYTAMFTSLLIATVHDPETGERVFTPDDASWLEGKSGAAVNTVFEVAQQVSGMGAKATDEAKKDSA